MGDGHFAHISGQTHDIALILAGATLAPEILILSCSLVLLMVAGEASGDSRGAARSTGRDRTARR